MKHAIGLESTQEARVALNQPRFQARVSPLHVLSVTHWDVNWRDPRNEVGSRAGHSKFVRRRLTLSGVGGLSKTPLIYFVNITDKILWALKLS